MTAFPFRIPGTDHCFTSGFMTYECSASGFETVPLLAIFLTGIWPYLGTTILSTILIHFRAALKDVDIVANWKVNSDLSPSSTDVTMQQNKH